MSVATNPRSHTAAQQLTVDAVLRAHARTRPDHVLLTCDAEQLTYRDADRRSARLARGLIALGAGKGTHVGVLYPNGADFVVAALAAARIGAVVVPCSTFSTTRELREQLVHADIRILLSAMSYRSHDYVQRLTEIVGDADSTPLLCANVPQLRQVVITGSPCVAAPLTDLDDVSGPLADTVTERLLEAMAADVVGSDPMAIVYTSGSTSAPKGVVHTHSGLLEHQRNLNEIRGLTEQDRLFCNSPFFWIGGFAYGLLATLVAGSTLLCSNAIDPGETLDLLEAQRPTMTNGFSAGVAHLAQHPSFAGRDLTSIRRGNLYPIMPERLRPADPELRHNMLGMTEAGSVLLLSGDESDQPEQRRGSFGTPAPGFEVELVDPDTGAPVEDGELGELCFRGPYVMLGYHKRSREDCFDADGWFHTGDLARRDADGFVYFVGRLGAMIKTAGANVAPAEVEKAIAKVTGEASHVFGIPDPVRGQVVAAVIVSAAQPATFDQPSVRALLRDELSAYKIPARFAVVPESQVPLLSSGKVDLQELRKVFDA